MKSALKGIEMKLIQILALAIAIATVATAQNPSATSQGKASPTPTPAAAGKTGGTAQPATKKAAGQSGTKTSAGTPAKATTEKSVAAKGASASSASSKPAVKAATVPVKAHAPAGTQAKGAPTPVVAAKGTAGATDAKKTESKKAEAKKTEAKKTEAKKDESKKADTKKGNATKAPAVIAVKPAQGTKKTKKTGAQTAAIKTPAKAPAPQVTQLGPSTQTAEKPKPAPRTFGAHGRRDPFVSPIVAKDGGINRPPSNCTSGKRCLVIPELILQGTIKDTSGKMMAVVANSIKKTYFLRENDQVFQGSVEKITSDSIIFREYVKDGLGRETAREVVKKLVPAS
jgi:Tfp pilus assembly protein PilP